MATTGRSIWNGWLVLSIGLVLSTGIAAQSWVKVRLHQDRTIDVTGSAKRRIVSDLIQWQASIETENKDRTAGYHALAGHVQQTLAYLKKQGITDSEVRVAAADTEQVFETEYVGKSEDRIEKKTFKGYKISQAISVDSKDVAKIERVSREVTQLMDSGVPITSQAPSYYYTGLGALKIEMLAEAARDARVRADRMLQSTGGASLGRLRRADMGVININPANATAVSSEGNNDTTSLDKDILTIVHCRFELDR